MNSKKLASAGNSLEKKLHTFFTTALVTIVAVTSAHAGGDPVFLAKDGIVAIEMESTDSSLRRWKKKTDVDDYSGPCHLEFTGNKPEMGPPNSPPEYHFQVDKPGTYQLVLRARKRLISERQDICNDCFVRLEGDYAAGGKAGMNILKEDTKLFGGHADKWAWAKLLDHKHKKYPALYKLKPGETYVLSISGRSQNFNLDRFVLVHESHKIDKVLKTNPKESERAKAGVDSKKSILQF